MSPTLLKNKCFLICMLSCLVSCSDDQVDITGGDIDYTGIPIVNIQTPEQTTIKRQYVQHSILDITYSPELRFLSGEIKIKGRGNTSWIYPKKPYTFLLTNGPQPAASWVLLANYDDKSLMRNDIAFFMGREMSCLDYTPEFWFADFILNGQYEGIYQIGEGIDVGADRVDVGEDGVLLEVDGKSRYHEVTFSTTRLTHPINIHYPEVIEGSSEFNEIKSYMQKAEDALFAENFTDEKDGYRKYFDIDSFVEWYIINEIAKNVDAAFFTSCFIHLRKGGKLKMGPLWDFSMAFGGHKNNDFGRTIGNVPENFYLKNTRWYARMFQDPVFVGKVKERFCHYFSHRQMIYDRIDVDCQLLLHKVYLDNRLWGRLCDNNASETKVESAYHTQVEYLKEWIEKRMSWLKTNIDAL